MVIKHSIIDVLRGAFPDQGDGFILSAKELLNSIEGRHKDELVAFLMAKLINSRYNDKGVLSVHIKSMYDIATKLKHLGSPSLMANLCNILWFLFLRIMRGVLLM
jgi:hypothetical protein